MTADKMEGNAVGAVRRLDQIPTEAGTCGFRKPVFTATDSDQLAVSFLRIANAKAHYHAHTTEIYFVLTGEGELFLNGKPVLLLPGTAVLIPPGVVHKAVSHDRLEVLVVMSPPLGEREDHIVV